jgi:hypothetical protein
MGRNPKYQAGHVRSAMAGLFLLAEDAVYRKLARRKIIKAL